MAASKPMMFGQTESTASLITFSVGLQYSAKTVDVVIEKLIGRGDEARRQAREVPWAGRQTA